MLSRPGLLSSIIFTLGVCMASSPQAATVDTFVSEQLAAGKKANSLINEKSPYLLQHAFNPVQWLPWGEEAFARAERQDKPIFLSIGYSTCHWCHVMAHESFEDEEVAAFLNEHFIAIKVDREERPDIDQLYMTATQAISGSGGWPMSVFLLPDRRPFYAGTYFPPQATYGRPGFLDLLRQIQALWQEDRSRLTGNAEVVSERLAAVAEHPGTTSALSDQLFSRCLKQANASFDREFGGFAPAPKFPRPVIFDLLLRIDHRKESDQARHMALFSLETMAAGGMYDHLGGGFHRYSVDEQWRIPHFEKMLYDQAQLASLYLDAFLVSGEPLYRQIATATLDYVLRDMTDPGGGFYSAEDADSKAAAGSSDHGEGLFYLWTEAEINEILGHEQAAIFTFLYGIEPGGNALHDPTGEFSGKNVLYRKHSTAQAARHFDRSQEEVSAIRAQALQKLFALRQQRPRPHLDDKIITAWNGLMISALAKGFRVTGQEKYLAAATRAAAFIEEHLFQGQDNTLRRRFRAGEAQVAGQLDDYAFYAQGLLDLYGAGFDSRWLALAEQLTKRQIALFSPEEPGAFYDTPASAANLLVRMRNDFDGAEPAGNSVTAMNLLRLSQITDNDQWRAKAEAILAFFSEGLAENPFGRPALAAAYDFSSRKPRQIVIAGRPAAADTTALLTVINRHYLPNTIVLLADNGPGQAYLAGNLPFLEFMRSMDGRAAAYVCENFTCKEPLTDPAALADLLQGS